MQSLPAITARNHSPQSPPAITPRNHRPTCSIAGPRAPSPSPCRAVCARAVRLGRFVALVAATLTEVTLRRQKTDAKKLVNKVEQIDRQSEAERVVAKTSLQQVSRATAERRRRAV